MKSLVKHIRHIALFHLNIFDPSNIGIGNRLKNARNAFTLKPIAQIRDI